MNSEFLFLFALLLFTPAAKAASWHTLQTGTQMTLQADEPQVEAVEKKTSDVEKPKARKLKAWDKTTYSQPQLAMPGDFYYTSAKSLSEINCTTRTLKTLQRIYYDSDGNEIKSIHYGKDDMSEPVVPETSGEAVFNFACTFKAEKAITRTQPSPKAKQPAPQPEASKRKAKEPQTAASTKPPAKPATAAPTTKPADTKKATP